MNYILPVALHSDVMFCPLWTFTLLFTVDGDITHDERGQCHQQQSAVSEEDVTLPPADHHSCSLDNSDSTLHKMLQVIYKLAIMHLLSGLDHGPYYNQRLVEMYRLKLEKKQFRFQI